MSQTKDQDKANAATKGGSAIGGAGVDNFKSLRFPSDLGTNNVPAYIRFVPKTTQYGGTEGIKSKPNYSQPKIPSLNDYKQSLGNQLKSKLNGVVDGLEDSLKNKVGSIFSSIGSNVSSKLGQSAIKKASNFVSGKISLGDFDIEIGTKTKPDNVFSEASISLYLPESLQAATSAGYSGTEAGMLGKELSKGNKPSSVKEGSSLVEAGMLDGLKQMTSNIEAAKTGLAMGKGIVSNNYSFQIFDGMEHRNFSYTFNLVPKNEKETYDIKDICDTFLYYMLPEKDVDNDIGYYRIPAMWEIGYYYQGKTMEFHQQPNGHLFLTSVDVSYGGEGGNSLHTDGSPMAVELTLSFVEIEPMYRNKGSK